ncbi:hypothetical protein ACFQ09_12715 [Massilia norwichensis]|uniref:Uncharacterized protein n=1 Tax=Massilia norwichensis TaxID=1442366 RepID=A0ABT2ACD3_9BURK|nr:hypothetical protein [Massilia norwichensis]MCS0591827.1 hypothetical protein [Massilia norwichensis]
MNPYSFMLQQASMEMRQFQQTSPEASYFEKSWLERLAARLEHASSLSEQASAEREVLAIARSDIDSGPMNPTAMPSFYQALDAVQRARKRRTV